MSKKKTKGPIVPVLKGQEDTQLSSQRDTTRATLNEDIPTKDAYLFQSESFHKALDVVETMNKKKPH